MRPFLHRLRRPAPYALAAGLLFVAIPLAARGWLGWSHPLGYLSDLAVGGALWLLALRLRSRPWLTLPLMALWALMTLGSAELIRAMGRMAEPADLAYLLDPQFVARSAGAGGLSLPWLAAALAATLALALAAAWRGYGEGLPRRAWLLPVALLAIHAAGQHRLPLDSPEWHHFNLPHKWLAARASAAALALDGGEADGGAVDISPFTALDLGGTPLLARPGSARNVLIVTLEGIPGAYLAASRAAIGGPYREALMPRLSQWAERGMLTTDYVLHHHQTIRGLYSMLCGDYDKLDAGTPKGIELLSNPGRGELCLPAQLRRHGFATHFLQGAGLRFMAKDRVMPRMGFDHTRGLEWFRNPPQLAFSWGMDDKGFFAGALDYIDTLRAGPSPWMLTLLTVGTHQPYAAPADYLARHGDPRKAAVAYLDDAVGHFLDTLDARGVLDDTLVIVTSDESHGLDQARLASAWGFNLLLAPEQAQLPRRKEGVYGHIDLAASVLDYLALPVPAGIAGRSLLRDYGTGREILSHTNGRLRRHDGRGTLTECDAQQHCRRYLSDGFIAATAAFAGTTSGAGARQLSRQAERLNRSLMDSDDTQRFDFADRTRIHLKGAAGSDWEDSLVGAQYLALPAGSRTTLTLRIRALALGKEGARLILKAKEYDRDLPHLTPPLPTLTARQPIDLQIAFDNPVARRAFSFHLLGEGRGTIEITEFSVSSEPLAAPRVAGGRPRIDPGNLLYVGTGLP